MSISEHVPALVQSMAPDELHEYLYHGSARLDMWLALNAVRLVQAALDARKETAE